MVIISKCINYFTDNSWFLDISGYDGERFFFASHFKSKLSYQLQFIRMSVIYGTMTMENTPTYLSKHCHLC